YVWIMLPISGEHDPHDLHFIEVIGWKQGADRTVDQARGQDLFGRRPPFPFDKTAWKFTGRVGFFPVIDYQREKIPGFVRLPFTRCHQCHGVPITDDDCAVSLFCQLSGFDDEILRAEWTFNTCLHGSPPTLQLEPNTEVEVNPDGSRNERHDTEWRFLAA